MKYTRIRSALTFANVGNENYIVWINALRPLSLFNSLKSLETQRTHIILASWGPTHKNESCELDVNEKIISTHEEITTTKSNLFQFAQKYVSQKAMSFSTISIVNTAVKK